MSNLIYSGPPIIARMLSRNTFQFDRMVVKHTRYTPGMKKKGYVGFGNELHKWRFENEIKWLEKMRGCGKVPDLIEYDKDKLTISMTYCGEPITKDNIPKNSDRSYMAMSCGNSSSTPAVANMFFIVEIVLISFPGVIFKLGLISEKFFNISFVLSLNFII